MSDAECGDHLVCGDCMGSSHADVCCQYSGAVQAAVLV